MLSIYEKPQWILLLLVNHGDEAIKQIVNSEYIMVFDFRAKENPVWSLSVAWQRSAYLTVEISKNRFFCSKIEKISKAPISKKKR